MSARNSRQGGGGIEELAVDVELALVPGAVAHPDRGAGAPAGQAGQFAFGQVALPADPVHDLQVGAAGQLAGGRRGHEPEELRRPRPGRPPPRAPAGSCSRPGSRCSGSPSCAFRRRPPAGTSSGRPRSLRSGSSSGPAGSCRWRRRGPSTGPGSSGAAPTSCSSPARCPRAGGRSPPGSRTTAGPASCAGGGGRIPGRRPARRVTPGVRGVAAELERHRAWRTP